ncbi:hypothetical protein I3760_11G056100 [Carya illinoinensis]|nr:hypothetical protein I3760_11G056100 [Carya illinoinensis]
MGVGGVHLYNKLVVWAKSSSVTLTWNKLPMKMQVFELECSLERINMCFQ